MHFNQGSTEKWHFWRGFWFVTLTFFFPFFLFFFFLFFLTLFSISWRLFSVFFLTFFSENSICWPLMLFPEEKTRQKIIVVIIIIKNKIKRTGRKKVIKKVRIKNRKLRQKYHFAVLPCLNVLRKRGSLLIWYGWANKTNNAHVYLAPRCGLDNFSLVPLAASEQLTFTTYANIE